MYLFFVTLLIFGRMFYDPVSFLMDERIDKGTGTTIGSTHDDLSVRTDLNCNGKVVCKYQRMDLIEDIFAAYDRYCDEQNQVLNAVLTCTVPPSEEQKKGMEAFLCKKYGAKKAKIEVCQDQALLGGFILRVGSDEYDWSMKGRLNRLEQRLTWR